MILFNNVFYMVYIIIYYLIMYYKIHVFYNSMSSNNVLKYLYCITYVLYNYLLLYNVFYCTCIT